MQSKRGLATCPPVPQGKQRQARKGWTVRLTFCCGCFALRTAHSPPGRSPDCRLFSPLPGSCRYAQPPQQLLETSPHAPQRLWLRVAPICFEVSRQCPARILRQGHLRLVPWPPGWCLPRHSAQGTDQDGVLRCLLLCDHALQRQQVGAGRSGAISATATMQQCSVDDVVADGMRQRPDVVTALFDRISAENRAAEAKSEVQPGKTLRHHGFPRDSSTQYWCGST